MDTTVYPPRPYRVVLIIKTGDTETLEKVPAHLETTFMPWPIILVYPDHTESIGHHMVEDTVGNVTEEMRHQHKDFAWWQRLISQVRASLRPHEGPTADAEDANSPYGIECPREAPGD
jgi:hypothetical protein